MKSNLDEFFMLEKGVNGVVEIIIKDRNGNVVEHMVEKNIVKIFAKEMLAYRLGYSKVWNPDGNSGAGAWEDSGIDPFEEFAAKYILFGASFDESGTPLGTNDTRYYTTDPVTGLFVPVRLSPAADFEGGLINAIPIEEPSRPLKRVENISFKSTYQPSSSPLVDSSVRAINNVVSFETVLRIDEYNGFTNTSNDFFTITEVALAAGTPLDSVAQCGLTPSQLFLEGTSGTGTASYIAVNATANGTNTISIDSSEPTSSLIFSVGDQIKIVANGAAQDTDQILGQINPYYLVTGYSGGRDIVLDRVPVDSSGTPLSGNIGIFRNTLRLFSHRILSSPVQKSENFEITVRWNIVFN